MAEQHRLARAASISAPQLQDEAMLVFDNTFLQRHLLDPFCSNARVRFNIALESNFVPLVIAATRSGMGVSTLLRSVQEQEPGKSKNRESPACLSSPPSSCTSTCAGAPVSTCPRPIDGLLKRPSCSFRKMPARRCRDDHLRATL